MDNIGTKEINFAQGWIICESCGRVIPSRLMLENSINYMISECPFENKVFKTPHSKSPYLNSIKVIPKNWPSWNVTEGNKNQFLQPVKDIKNFKDIPTFCIPITTRCNSSCAICRIKDNNNPRELDINSLKKILVSLRQKEICFTGGEPTVRDDLPQIIRLIRKTGNFPSFFTNGLKLADRFYLKELKKAGLDHVHLSFDGFNNRVYEELRGGIQELELKIKAIENLEKEHIITKIRSTIVNGINDGEVGNIINFTKKNRYIVGVDFRPISLRNIEVGKKFNEEHLLSFEELRSRIAKAIKIFPEEFQLWDKLKINLALFLEYFFPFLKTPVLPLNCIYLRRVNSELITLSDRVDLRKLNNNLSERRFKGIIGMFRLISPILTSSNFKIGSLCFMSHSHEKLLWKLNLFSIRVDAPTFFEVCFSSMPLVNTFFIRTDTI